jgi:Zinc finger, C3HC4 type (RING finger)
MSHNTPFSFHCMICFEEFHPEERYPVVLPCGHTYVCNACADRLDKCMECRTPLYTIVESKSQQGGSNNTDLQAQQYSTRPNWANARSGGRPITNQGPPQAPIKKRVVLPKNVVLLSLIEATELASEDARKKYMDSPLRNSHSADLDMGVTSIPMLQSLGSMIDMDDEEEERIRMSTSLAVGVAGTYAVAIKDGLEIFPSRPTTNATSGIETRDEDVDSLVRFYNAEQSDDYDGTPNSRKSKDHLRLSFGDRVQIVSVDGGWAKLSRGYGFVQANSNQLVKGEFSFGCKNFDTVLFSHCCCKVGGSVDRACKLEAILCSLSNRRKALRIEQSKVDNQFIRYMNDLQHSLQNDEDLTVILADTFLPLPEIPEFADFEKEEKSSTVGEEEWDEHSFVLKPALPERSSTPPLQGRVSRFACFSREVFEDCDTGLHGGDSFMEDRIHNQNVAASTLFPNASHPSPSAMRAGAQAWREQHGREAEASVDFRTGLSGHMSLLSTHANSHKYLEPTYRPSKPNRMSSHTGLPLFSMPSINGILSSLTLPVIGNTPPRRPNPEGIPHNGTM